MLQLSHGTPPPPPGSSANSSEAGCSLYPDAAEILCSTHVRLFFTRHSSWSQLTKRLVQSARGRVSEYMTTEGVCCSFTNVQHHCGKVLQGYSSMHRLTHI